MILMIPHHEVCVCIYIYISTIMIYQVSMNCLAISYDCYPHFWGNHLMYVTVTFPSGR